MRFGKLLLTLLFAALFLLLLSALVVSPPAEMPAAQPAPLTGARLLPLALPAAAAGNAEELRSLPLRLFFSMLLFALCTLPLPALKRDANGRVLQAKRYENSFYQVFRQEVAGG